ncbi:MAG: SDR family oxidoreductase [Thermoplasmata archaeon]|nr:MAG: SDR family oxidoreductase [Thermoplasmata archaeon]
MPIKLVFKGKRVLITGGAGFIGSHLAELLAPGNDVTILDDGSTGKLENIKKFENRVEFVEGSILDVLLLKKVLKDIEIVFHLAALPSVERSVKDPKSTHEVNTTGTLNMLTIARDYKISKFIYASSSSVYGDTPELPKNEKMGLNPLSPYAVSKAVGELYCKVFTKVYRLPTVVLRYFNVFGPRQNPKSQYAAVIPKFIDLMSQNQKPLIYGDGKQTRDFTFVDNVLWGTELAAVAKDVEGEVFNIACGNQISVNALVDTLNNIMAKDIKPIYTDPRSGDIKHSRADILKATRLLGYEEVVSFEEGVKRTVENMVNSG